VALDASAFPGEEEVYRELTELNQRLIFSRTSPYPHRVRYEVKPGDNLWLIVKRLQKENALQRLTTEFIQRTNGLSSPSIRPGLVLSIPKEPLRIQVNRSRFLLTLYLGDVILRRYPVCLGKDDKTPQGRFMIQSRLRDPAWIQPGKTIPFGSPENVLGTRWLGFKSSSEADGLGIHGTWEPETIGKLASNGCVRLSNPDVEELFDLVSIGTEVVIE
jgi:LysM repeat protein